jgi:spore coat protein H
MSGLRSVALQFVVFFFVGWSAAAIGIVPSLPTLELSTSQDVSSETKIPCTVRWVPSPTGVDRTANTKLLNGKVRIHGASSQSYEKKSLALSLDSPTRWLGLTSGRQWVLNAAYVDCSLMRHKLSYDLFQSLSSEGVKRHASSSGFVELRFNGQYHGTYLLMERVEGSLLGFTPKGQPSKVPAVLYKAIDHEANFGNPGHSGYEQREPSPEDQEYWGPLDDLNQFVATAKDADFANAQSGIGSRLDIDNAIDFHLLVLFTSNMDGFDKNFILARNAVTEAHPVPRFFFVPWDYDATFGRNWEGSPVEPTFWLSNHLFDRLLSHEMFRRKYLDRWQALRRRQFSVETVHRMIDDNARSVATTARRNESRWTPIRGAESGSLAFTEDVAQMKEWVVARTRWLDAEMERQTRR